MTDRDIAFHRPSLDAREVEAVREVLASGWLTTGPRVREFEREIAALVGSGHAVAVNSCTAALHLALEAVGVAAGDEVIVPTMTFAATGEIVHYLGARPVLVDSVPDTLNMDPDDFARRITPSTRAVIPVHYAGHPCDMDAIVEIARRAGVRVVEDAAHALPARYRGRMIGSIGDLTAFSFYATKNLATGEGGMLCTDNDEWEQRARLMSLHGLSRDAWRRYASDGSWDYAIMAPGFKYNLSDVLAAVGSVQLQKLAGFQERRRAIVARYQAAFGDLDAVECPAERPEVEHAWHLYVLRLRLERLDIDRNGAIEELRRLGIQTSVHFIPLHMHPYYREAWGFGPEDFPVAFAASQRIISLPLYPAMDDEAVERVIGAVREVVLGHRRPGAF